MFKILMIPFCLFGNCKILNIQNLSDKAVLKVFFKRANGQMDKVLAFRSNVPRFDPTTSAHIFYHLCKINNS